MAIIIKPETMDRLNALAGDLTRAAFEECDGLFDIAAGATDDERDQARAVQAVIFSVNAILQSMPLNQGGVVIAMGAVSGTVLAQCEGERMVLYRMFQTQMARTMAEVAAARMSAQGTA